MSILKNIAMKKVLKQTSGVEKILKEKWDFKKIQVDTQKRWGSHLSPIPKLLDSFKKTEKFVSPFIKTDTTLA